MGKKIFEPIQIKSMVMKNRISFGPMLGQPHGPDWEVDDNTIEWYVQRAKGDTGMALTGTINPMPSWYETYKDMPSMGFPHPLTIHDDSYIPGYKKLADAVHKYGMKMGAQVGAGGAMQGASPSPYPRKNFLDVMYGMDVPVESFTLEELDIIKNDLAVASARVKEAGFDCVELHTAHGYVSLWGGFMSPFTNTRTDKYGGSWENRLRYPVESIQAMRKAVGDDFPILIRISADELFGDEGVTLEDTLKYSIPMLEEAGVDCFDVTMGSQLHNPNNIPSLYVPRGHYFYLPDAVRKVAKVPVIGVGRILELDMAEKFLQQGMADIICLGRQLISDPETPKKYFEGRPEDIRKCIGDLPGFGGCCECCAVNPTPPNMISCDEVVKTDSPKKILVIGGGVAGMEAARIAALRGHEVILFEKERSLGGNVDILANTSLNYEFRNLVDYLSVQMSKLGVDVRVCREVTEKDMAEIKPDVLILATGATMSISGPAKDKLNVMTHIQALKNIHTIGQRVVIQGLGYGSELAIALAEMGRDVTVFGKAKEIASNVVPLRRYFLLKRLTDIDVTKGDGDIPTRKQGNPLIMTGTGLVDTTPEGVVVKEGNEGKESILPYDTFIISMGRKANNELYDQLKDKVSKIYKIGDCKEIGEIFEAMQAANELGKKI